MVALHYHLMDHLPRPGVGSLQTRDIVVMRCTDHVVITYEDVATTTEVGGRVWQSLVGILRLSHASGAVVWKYLKVLEVCLV